MIRHGVSRAGNPFWGRINEPEDSRSEYVHFNRGWVYGHPSALGLPHGTMGYFYCHKDCIVEMDTVPSCDPDCPFCQCGVVYDNLEEP